MRPRDGSAKTPKFWQKPIRKGDIDDSDGAESCSSSSSDGFFGLCPDDDGRLSAHNLTNSASSSLFDTHSLADISVDQWHADQKAYFAALNKHDQEPDNVSCASENDSDLDPEDDLPPPTKKSPSELQVRLDACRHELRIFSKLMEYLKKMLFC